MTRPLLVLVGMPGSGKSSVASAVGERLGAPVADTDALVAERAGRPEQDAFVDLGEDRFRDLERAVVTEVLSGRLPAVGAGTPGAIVALGSGAVEHATEHLAVARAAGTRVVHLDVALAQAAPRSGMVGSQPMGLGAPRALLAQFAAARRPVYESAADTTVDAAAMDLDAVIDRVLALLDRD